MPKQDLPPKRQDFSQRRSGLMLWTSAIALFVVVLLIFALSGTGSRFYSRGVVAAAVLLLLVRLVGRIVKVRSARAAQPDPQSTLRLD
jgi:hypothetical protein